jgi:hypothetical protein
MPQLAEGDAALPASVWAAGVMQLYREAYDFTEDFPNALNLMSGVVSKLLAAKVLTFTDVASLAIAKALDAASPRIVAGYFATLIKEAQLTGADVDTIVEVVAEATMEKAHEAKDRLTRAGVEF